MNSFEGLVEQLKGQAFVLSNSDLVFIFKDAALDETEAAIVKMRFLFSDDPMLVDEGTGGKPYFIEWFDLERDYEALLALAQRAAHEEEARRDPGIRQGIRGPAGGRAGLRRPAADARKCCTGSRRRWLRADLANLMRRQAVCAIVGRAAPQPIFHELFISIAELRETLLPDVNLASSPWLFQQLTETLDRRVLSMLNKHDDRTMAGDVSINLNVQTLIAQEFLVLRRQFAGGHAGHHRGGAAEGGRLRRSGRVPVRARLRA